MENIQETSECYVKPVRQGFSRGKYQDQDMSSDSDEDILVDDLLTSKQGLVETSDEELNDDLLCSDEEDKTMRCHDEQGVQAIAKPYLVCFTSHLAEDQPRCPQEEQTEEDDGEVLDIEINAPSGDEFQEFGDCSAHHQANVKTLVKDEQESTEDGSKMRKVLSAPPSGRGLKHSCGGQSAPEETLTGPCHRPEPVFPGQHMFDQQLSSSVLDTNPLLAGPTPMGSFQPPGYESDPWRPSPALQGPTDLSKPGTPCRGHFLLKKHPSAQSGCSFTVPSGPQTQKPAVLVKAVARMVQSAKPMAVARGMPIAAKQTASAKSKISAKTPPAPWMVGRNKGQKVKVESQFPPATQNLTTTPLNKANNKEHEQEVVYRQKLQQQMRLRALVIQQKERMRSLRAKKWKLLEGFQTAGSTGLWSNNQNPQKVTQLQLFHNPSRVPIAEKLLEYQQLFPQQQENQVFVPVLQQQAPSGHAAQTLYHQPDHWVADGPVSEVPTQTNQQHSNGQTHAPGPQEIQQATKRIVEQRISEEVPTKMKHFSHDIGNGSAASYMPPQMSEETEPRPRVVTFRMPDLSTPLLQQHGLKIMCPKNQPMDKVAVRENQRSAFMPFDTDLRTEPVTAQTHVNFIVRLNH